MDSSNKKENFPPAGRQSILQLHTFADIQIPEDRSLARSTTNQQPNKDQNNLASSAAKIREDTSVIGVAKEGQTIDTKALNRPEQNKGDYINLDEIIGVNPTSSKSTSRVQKRTRAVLPPPRINIPRKSKAKAYEKLRMIKRGIFTLVLLDKQRKPKRGRPKKVKPRASKTARGIRKRKPRVAKSLTIRSSGTTIQSCYSSDPCSACAECSSYTMSTDN